MLDTEKRMSNGLLLAMEPDRRAETIAELSPQARIALARMCAIGVGQGLRRSERWRQSGHAQHADHHRNRAGEFGELAAQLLTDI